MDNIKIYKTEGSFAVYFSILALIPGEIMFLVLFFTTTPIIPDAIPFILFASMYNIMMLWALIETLRKVVRRFWFTKEGIIIIEKKNHFIPWEQFSYVYFCKGYKNRQYMVLTNQELGDEKLKRWGKPGFIKDFPAVSADGTVTLDLFNIKREERSEIREIVSANVPNVNIEIQTIFEN